MSAEIFAHLAGLGVLALVAAPAFAAILKGEPVHVAYLRLIPGLEGKARRAMLRHAGHLEAEAADLMRLATRIRFHNQDQERG